MAPPGAPERAVLDASALLGVNRAPLVAAAAFGYYTAYWSPWIVSEFVRKRTEWIADPDDWPVMQTALAAGATVLMTDNAADFPLGETRCGIVILGSVPFLARLYGQFPDAEAAIDEYLAP